MDFFPVPRFATPELLYFSSKKWWCSKFNDLGLYSKSDHWLDWTDVHLGDFGIDQALYYEARPKTDCISSECMWKNRLFLKEKSTHHFENMKIIVRLEVCLGNYKIIPNLWDLQQRPQKPTKTCLGNLLVFINLCLGNSSLEFAAAKSCTLYLSLNLWLKP